MRLTIAGREYQLLSLPSLDDVLDGDHANVTFQVNEVPPDPIYQPVVLEINGNVAYRGEYVRLTYDPTSGRSEIESQSYRSLAETSLPFSGLFSGKVSDIVGSWLSRTNLSEIYGTPSYPEDPVLNVKLDPCPLSVALDQLCGTLMWQWKIDTTTKRLVFVSETEGTSSPWNVELPYSNCFPMYTGAIKTTTAPLGPDKIIVQGANAPLDQLGNLPIAVLSESTGDKLKAGSLQRIFPLLSGRTRVVSVDLTTSISELGPFIVVTPVEEVVYDTSSTAALFLVRTFNTGEQLTLIAIGLDADTFTFDHQPAESNDSVPLEVTPTDGAWTDGSNEEGNFVVWGYTDGAVGESVDFNVENNALLEDVQITIRSVSFTFKASPAGVTEIQIGVSDSDSEDNAATVIESYGNGLAVSTAIVSGKMRVTSVVPGYPLSASSSDTDVLSVETVEANAGEAYPQTQAFLLTGLDNSLVGETLTVGGLEYTFVSGIPGSDEIAIGATLADTMEAIAVQANVDQATTGFMADFTTSTVTFYNTVPGTTSSVLTSAPSKLEITDYARVYSSISIVPCEEGTWYWQQVSSTGSQDCGYSFAPTSRTFQLMRDCGAGSEVVAEQTVSVFCCAEDPLIGSWTSGSIFSGTDVTINDCCGNPVVVSGPSCPQPPPGTQNGCCVQN